MVEQSTLRNYADHLWFSISGRPGVCLVRSRCLNYNVLYDIHQVDGLHILAVNLGETPAVVQDWVDSLELTYDILLDEDEAVAALYRLRVQPTTLIIAPDGIITHIFYGPASMNQLQATVSAYF